MKKWTGVLLFTFLLGTLPGCMDKYNAHESIYTIRMAAVDKITEYENPQKAILECRLYLNRAESELKKAFQYLEANADETLDGEDTAQVTEWETEFEKRWEILKQGTEFQIYQNALGQCYDILHNKWPVKENPSQPKENS